ncbi:MAG: hypothetical protein H0U12_11030 [Thermoleophilaceae bacterium]|nr:hypothetical protein [Thermoleophilaceae bacterium]
MLGELDDNRRIVICDLEAGVGSVVRVGQADLVLVVAEATTKSIEVARRAVEIAGDGPQVVVIANRVCEEADTAAVRDAVPGCEVIVLPEEPAIARADREGVAPIDVDAGAPGVRAIVALAERVAGGAAVGSSSLSTS